jgi:hypothetical protein
MYSKLPDEIIAEIKVKAEHYANSSDASNPFPHEISIWKESYTHGATEWAQWKVKHNEAKKLLDEVFRKHEAGLLPDRFIYEKIKSFLNGE